MLACTFSSCQQYHSMGIGGWLATLIKSSFSSIGYKQLKSSFPPAALPKFFVVLLPSIGANIATTNKSKKELEENLGEEVTVVQIKCLDKYKPTDHEKPQLEAVYLELLSTLTHRFDLKSLVKSDAEKYLHVPMHILGCGQPSLVPFFAKKDYIFSPAFYLNFTFNIQTLAIVSVEDNKNAAKEDLGVQFFKYSEGESIADYIAYLKQQQG